MKKIIILFAILLLFTGCNNEQVVVIENAENKRDEVKKNKMHENKSEKKDESVTDEISESATVFNSEEEVINYFDDAYLRVSNYSLSDGMGKFKEKAKAIFFTTVDFIFYDKEIKGVKFSELTNSAKASVISAAIKMDSAIMKKWPNYKDNIAEKYQNITDILKADLEKTKSQIKNIVGEENYDKANDFIDTAKDKASDIYENVKDKTSQVIDSLDSWYQDKKTSN